MLTGSDSHGRAMLGAANTTTCNNWTSNAEGRAMLGHHDRLGGGNASWNAVHLSNGCSQANLVATGGRVCSTASPPTDRRRCPARARRRRAASSAGDSMHATCDCTCSSWPRPRSARWGSAPRAFAAPRPRRAVGGDDRTAAHRCAPSLRAAGVGDRSARPSAAPAGERPATWTPRGPSTTWTPRRRGLRAIRCRSRTDRSLLRRPCRHPRRLALACNEYGAKLVLDVIRRGRAAFAAMPLPDVDATVAEICLNAYDTLKVDGVASHELRRPLARNPAARSAFRLVIG